MRWVHPLGRWKINAAYPDWQRNKIAVYINKQKLADGNADDRKGFDRKGDDIENKDKGTWWDGVQYALFWSTHAGNLVWLLLEVWFHRTPEFGAWGSKN